MASLDERVSRIEARNRRVEADKAWETSITRRVMIVAVTYIIMALYLNAIGVVNPFLSAVVPALAFLIATMTFPYFKDAWVRYVYRR